MIELFEELVLEFNFSNKDVSRIGFSWAYDLMEILVSIWLHCYSRQQMREYPMMLALTQSAKLIWPSSIAVFISLLLYRMKRAMSGDAVLIMS